MIFRAKETKDWVIATGHTTAVREFVKMAFAETGITHRFEREGESELRIIVSIYVKKYHSILNSNNQQRPTSSD